MPRKKKEPEPKENETPNLNFHMVAIPTVAFIYTEAEKMLDEYRDKVHLGNKGDGTAPLTQKELAIYFMGVIRFIVQNLHDPEVIAVQWTRLFTYAYMRRMNLLPELDENEIAQAQETTSPPEINIPDEIKFKGE